MARGPSGRIIVEMEPSLKRELHARLASEGRSLKDWLLECAENYLEPAQQTLALRVAEPQAPDYDTRRSMVSQHQLGATTRRRPIKKPSPPA